MDRDKASAQVNKQKIRSTLVWRTCVREDMGHMEMGSLGSLNEQKHLIWSLVLLFCGGLSFQLPISFSIIPHLHFCKTAALLIYLAFGW